MLTSNYSSSDVCWPSVECHLCPLFRGLLTVAGDGFGYGRVGRCRNWKAVALQISRLKSPDLKQTQE